MNIMPQMPEATPLKFKSSPLSIPADLSERGVIAAQALLAPRICIVVLHTRDDLIAYGVNALWPDTAVTDAALLGRSLERARKHLDRLEALDQAHWAAVAAAGSLSIMEVDAGGGP